MSPSAGSILDPGRRIAQPEAENREVIANLSMSAAHGYSDGGGAIAPPAHPRLRRHELISLGPKLFRTVLGTALIAAAIVVAALHGSRSHDVSFGD
ncbi:hypothetical protein A4G28_16160 [Mycobacterium ostraviense]|uniref:Uncharacterized protein n=1 Tax=Mycobacterium ostraviense TaxID=2738409 RepID=A0A164DVV5_9MYCO|nr:hypothetical protein A4G28_16160 [Mycobacterium ostraviense]